jgi:hypothetical protein
MSFRNPSPTIIAVVLAVTAASVAAEDASQEGKKAQAPSAATPGLALVPGDVNVLMADRAKRSGMLNVTVWGKPEGRAWVENWKRPDDTFQWTVEAPQAGRYEVSVLAEGSVQAEAEIVSDGGRIAFRLPKGWDKLILAEPLPVPKGRSTITLRLLEPDIAKLKSLELINLAARGDIQRRIERLRASTRWLRDAKYGIMFQWGGWGYPQHGGIFPAGPQKGLFAHGMFVLDGPDWGINGPDIKINPPAFSAERAVGLVRRAAERGQTLSFNLLMYEDGSVSPTSLEVLRAVRKAIRGKTSH